MHALMGSPLGDITLVVEGDAVTGIYFTGHLRPPASARLGQRIPVAEHATLVAARTQLTEYFAGERTDFDLPLAPPGTDFDRRVWALLSTIGYGRTSTYGQLARQLGDPGAAQAVGAANGRNPLSIVVPCHRVVGADGALTGYAGGLDRKRFLLDLEQPGTRLF